MSKKKDKGDKAGKAKVIPKHIGGLKLPKELRRKGEELVAKASSPAGQAALAKGLTMAAGLATLAVERRAAAKSAAPNPAESAEGAPPAPSPPLEPAKIVEAVHTVADAVLGRLFGGRKA